MSVDTLTAIASSAAGQSLPLSGGTLSASVAGSGPWSSITLDAHAQVERFFLSHERFQKLSADLSGTWPQWTAGVELTHREDEVMRLNASGTGTERVDARVESSPWSLEHVTGASQGRRQRHRAGEGRAAGTAVGAERTGAADGRERDMERAAARESGPRGRGVTRDAGGCRERC